MDPLQHFLNIFIALLSIINPLGVVPFWITLTADRTEDEKAEIIIGVVKNVALVAIVFLLLGKLIMSFFGLSIEAIRLAGSLVIILLAIRTLFEAPKKLSSKTMERSMEREDISFSPMAMPLLVGPGVLAIILAFTENQGYIWESLEVAISYGIYILAIAVNLVAIFFALKYSKYVLKILGQGGITGLSRIMAFLLLCIGGQFLIIAIKSIAKDILAG